MAQWGAAWLSRVRHSSVGSMSGCCKPAPSSNLGSSTQWRPSTGACRDVETGAELSECYESMCMKGKVLLFSLSFLLLLTSLRLLASIRE